MNYVNQKFLAQHKVNKAKFMKDIIMGLQTLNKNPLNELTARRNDECLNTCNWTNIYI